MKRISRICIYFTLTVILLFSLYVAYEKIIKHENMVFIGNYGLATILSGSMEPTINVYDLVLVKKDKSYTNDDIVVFNVDNSLVVHRIVNKTNNLITTKGDANNTEDNPININDIKGKVIRTYKGKGKYISYLSNPVYIAVITILILMSDIFKKRHN